MRRSWMACLPVIVVAVLVLAGCTSSDGSSSSAPPGSSSPTTTSPTVDPGVADAAISKPLRRHERFLDLRMPEPYSPSAPYGTGTDDYRCFLLNPHLKKSAFVTGSNVLPGQPQIVHHVILFRIDRTQVSAAKQHDASDPGEGWTCFGGTGLGSEGGVGSLDRAPWLAAWAPGGGESLMKPGIGIPLRAGSRIIMQVHYNLLAGDQPDQSAARLRLAPGSDHIAALDTILLPAPVELPCEPEHRAEPLCSRQTAIQDVIKRFGPQAGFTISGLQLLCGRAGSRPGETQYCDRRVNVSGTIQAVAGHMHLLGRSISVTLNPGRDDEQTLFDVPVWDFDNQRAVPLPHPVHVHPGDMLRVTCRHDHRLHDELPAFDGQPERYVVWGEGTTDEMCLGIVLFTRDHG